MKATVKISTGSQMQSKRCQNMDAIYIKQIGK